MKLGKWVEVGRSKIKWPERTSAEVDFGMCNLRWPFFLGPITWSKERITGSFSFWCTMSILLHSLPPFFHPGLFPSPHLTHTHTHRHYLQTSEKAKPNRRMVHCHTQPLCRVHIHWGETDPGMERNFMSPIVLNFSE